MADFSPIRSRLASSAESRRYRSARELTRPRSTSCSINLLPRPSTSRAPLLTQWRSPPRRIAGQLLLTQRVAASSPSRMSSEPHSGQCFGSCTGWASAGLSSGSTRTTSGMISPALRTTTVSPRCRSSSAMRSALCRVARLTLVPAKGTGSNSATGVTAPVRPTCTATRSKRLGASSAGNFSAIAQRGAFWVKPAESCSLKSLSFTTTPSVA